MRRSPVFGLRAKNVDVQTAAEASMINREDQDHLAFAAASGRALCTFNVADYCILHERWISQDRARTAPTPESLSRLSNGMASEKNFAG